MRHVKIDGIAKVQRYAQLHSTKRRQRPHRVCSCPLLATLAWTAYLLVTAGSCLWFIALSVNQYIAFRVDTTTRLVYEQMVTFPTLTLCNMQPFSSEFAADLLVKTNSSFLAGETPEDNYRTYLDIQNYMNRTYGRLLTYDEKKQLGANIGDVLVNCDFQSRKCNASHFETLFHGYYLSCYQFNARGDVRTPISGYSNQLSVELYTGLPDRLDFLAKRGYWLFIHNSSETLRRSSSPFKITPGYGTNFVASRTIYTQQPSPYSECTVLDNKTLVGRPLANSLLFDTYSTKGRSYLKSQCVINCRQLFTARYCKCLSLSSSYPVGNLSLCLTSEERACEVTFERDIFKAGTFILDNCGPMCPVECTHFLFHSTITQFQYPYSDSYVTYVSERMMLANSTTRLVASSHNNTKQPTWHTYLGDNLVKFNMYYNTLAYEHVTEKAKMSGEELIGTVGGHLHLFMGMSLLSFVELVDLLFLLAVRAIRSEHQPPASSSASSSSLSSSSPPTLQQWPASPAPVQPSVPPPSPVPSTTSQISIPIDICV